MPLILQNSHRLFLRRSYIVWGFLDYDAVRTFFFPNGFGVGIGTLVLTVNVILLGGYVFGCHAFRHLIGGTFDRVSEYLIWTSAVNALWREICSSPRSWLGYF